MVCTRRLIFAVQPLLLRIDMEEVWKDIKGYEGLYRISNLGRVMSLMDNHGRKRIEPKILKGRLDGLGYKQVSLYKKCVRKFMYVHRLVAMAFIQNPNNYPIINHKDENPLNNVVNNLEWCDFRYNNTYGTRIERVIKNQRVKVIQYALDGSIISEHPSISEAGRKTGISSGHICHACKGLRHTAGGFIWSYNQEK